jgi:hypothetical protein
MIQMIEIIKILLDQVKVVNLLLQNKFKFKFKIKIKKK